MKYTESYFREHHIKSYKNRKPIFDLMIDKKPYRIGEIASRAGIKEQQHIHPIINKWRDLGIIDQVMVNGQKMVGTYKMNSNLIVGK